MKTPNANRLHIGIFGNVNVGKSSFLNAFTKQAVSLVSDIEGTTSDPVYKPMELHGIGPVVWMDTAGSATSGVLYKERNEKSLEVVGKCDIGLIVSTKDTTEETKAWMQVMKEHKVPYLILLNKMDQEDTSIVKEVEIDLKEEVYPISSLTGTGLEEVRVALTSKLPKDYGNETILEGYAKEKSLLLFVMPQDPQAPKGRLILPQVQTLRDALNKNCMILCTTLVTLEDSLQVLNRKPDLIVCDSQVVKEVCMISKGIAITTFSVLMANFKGDAKAFKENMRVFDTLKSDAKILIAEACTHAPMEEDIGRVKIPNLLRKKFGDALDIHVHAGAGFPEDIETYDIIIHCGACMFHKKHVESRMDLASQKGVPMTNYGMTIAYLQGVLDEIKV